jgi:VWFA-related protein
MRFPARLLLILLLLPRIPLRAATATETPDAPLPVPFVEREEVRFVILDIVAEERKRRWEPLRDLTAAGIEVRVDGRLMAIDQFENRCHSAPPPETGAAAGAAAGDVGSAGEAGGRYVFYFDLEHLEPAGRDSAFKAAIAWAARRVSPADEVMILTGGRGLRIVRGFLPAADGLLEDLEAARDDFRATELWGTFESMRLLELGEERNAAARGMQANAYAQIDRSKTRNSLANLRDVMTIFEEVQGTKNLILFADTIRLIPGRQYGGTTTPLVDVHTELSDLAGAANERNVRIYPVKAGLPPVLPRGDPQMTRADSAFTMLAHETGGRVLEGSNRVDGVFDRIAEDLSCYYRVGFRIRPRYSGRSESIRVQAPGHEGAVRFRHRQTLDDPTREELDADRVRAAFMAPSSAGAFPIAVRAAELFRQEKGARVRIEIESPLGAMLALPLPGGPAGASQVRMQIGARIAPLRAGGGPGEASHRAGPWADVAPDRETLGFARQAVLTIPPPPPAGGRPPDRIVTTQEFDAPPGRYRIVGVIQDSLAGTIAAAIADLDVGSGGPGPGPIGLASRDARAVLVQDEPSGGSAQPAPAWDGKALAAAPPLLPPGVVLSGTSEVERGAAAHLVYSVCVDRGEGGTRPAAGLRRSPGAGEPPSPEPVLKRSLTCGPEGEAIPLPEQTLPRDARCAPIVETIPARVLKPGRCRFEVLLESPGGDPERAVREFGVAGSALPDAAPTGTGRGD